MELAKFTRTVIQNDLAFNAIKIVFSLIIGLLGSTIVLTNLNQFAFYNYILSQGAPTPETGFKYIEFFVLILGIFLTLSSISFALLLSAALFAFDSLDKLVDRRVPKKWEGWRQEIIRVFGLFFIISFLAIIAVLLLNFSEELTDWAQIGWLFIIDRFIFSWGWFDQSQIGFTILLIALLFVLVLVFRKKFPKSGGKSDNNGTEDKEKALAPNKTEEKTRSTFARILLLILPLLLNAAILFYVGWVLKEPSQYGKLLRTIRHGGNIEVYFCFDNPEKYGSSLENCSNYDASSSIASVLIGHTDTEVIWRYLNSPDTYVTKSSEIKSYMIKAGKEETLAENFIYGGDVSFVRNLERADLQKALMVLLPGQPE